MFLTRCVLQIIGYFKEVTHFKKTIHFKDITLLNWIELIRKYLTCRITKKNINELMLSLCLVINV